MKHKIIELKNGSNYYILEDIYYNNKRYALAAFCNFEKDEIIEDNYIVLEIKIKNDDLYITDINDNNLAKTVTKLLLEKVRK